MPTYLCRFSCFGPDDFKGIEAWDHSSAAEEYAEYAHHNHDMWEYGDEWDEDYSIIVRDKDSGEEMTFNITREYYPSFSATKVAEARP